MLIERTKLKGVMLITPDVYADDRGYFKETLNKHHGFIPVQANHSVSSAGVIRGLHYQPDAAKLVWVAKGSILDVAFDMDTGEYITAELTDQNHKQLLVPAGMAHGFQALEDDTIVCYLMDAYYNPRTEGGINPLVVDWPIEDYIISEKDKNADKFPSK